MSNNDERDVVDLTDPKTAAYRARIAAAKSGSTPVGVVPMPEMPRLDQPVPGAAMDRGLGVQQSHNQASAAQVAQHAAAQGAQPPGAQGKHAGMMSPDQYQQAVSQGQAIPGVGGGYVANQPAGAPAPLAPPTTPMEIKGHGDQPANPIRAEGGLSQTTVEQLEAVGKAQEAQNEAEEEKELAKDVDPEYDYDSLGNVTRDLLSDIERRKAIEKRCTDMEFEDLILNQELRQEVPIKPGFIPIFRTPSGAEDLYVKRLMGDVEGSDRYIMDKFAVLSLCMGLYALNNQPLPDHRDSKGSIDEDRFNKKMEYILKYPIVLVGDMSTNFMWFNARVQKLLSLDKVKDF